MFVSGFNFKSTTLKCDLSYTIQQTDVTFKKQEALTFTVMVLTQNVRGAGNTAVQVIYWFFTIIFSAPHYPAKRFVQDCYFHHLLSKRYVFDDSLTNIVNALIHWFNFSLVTPLLHNVILHVKIAWSHESKQLVPMTDAYKMAATTVLVLWLMQVICQCR